MKTKGDRKKRRRYGETKIVENIGELKGTNLYFLSLFMGVYKGMHVHVTPAHTHRNCCWTTNKKKEMWEKMRNKRGKWSRIRKPGIFCL